ncbi:MAG TPA: hypothetical protein VJR05_15770 [Acidimicrobiia bacterium]|nr:hypothetical protein [Acidimicrobiia bacterium]
MIDLLRQADPAQGLEIDRAALLAKVEERIGLSTTLTRHQTNRQRPAAAGAVGFLVIALLVAAVLILRVIGSSPQPVFDFDSDELGELPGVEQVIPLDGGGVKGIGVDEDTLWVMNSLQGRLTSISAGSGSIKGSYEIAAYAEGVVIGGGQIWLSGYDHGGEILRFDPAASRVDQRIPLDGTPGRSVWFQDDLWVSNDQGELHRISSAGTITSTIRGSLIGAGLGYLWIEDPDTGLIFGLNPNVPDSPLIPLRPDLASAWSVRQVTEMEGKLWLMDGDYPWGTDLTSYDPNRGGIEGSTSITFGLHSMVEFEGRLWITSHTDHILVSFDPETGDVIRYPLPGKPGAVVTANGELWVALHQPGALLRIETGELTPAAPIVVDDWDRFPHRLLCVAGEDLLGPTVIMEPADWIDYGMWSVVQTQIAARGHTVCVNGYLEGDATPAERAAALDEALIEANVEGPYLLVAAGDGVHSTRLFAEGRTDLAGMVLVEPMPLGFGALLDEVTNGASHPPWNDLNSAQAATLTDLGDLPLTVIGHLPSSVFLADRFVDTFGREAAETLSDAWQDGLRFYSALTSRPRQVTVAGSAMEVVVWESPQVIVDEVLALLR